MWKFFIDTQSTNKHYNPEYPIVGYLQDPDGKNHQEVNCRSVKDARIFGNGALQALHTVGIKCDVNPIVADRLTL